MVRWLHGSPAGAPYRLAAGAAAIADPVHDGSRTGAGALYRGVPLEATPNPLAQGGRPTTMAHHEQQFGAHIQG